MGNLMLAAHSLGLASIWIHRAKEERQLQNLADLVGRADLCPPRRRRVSQPYRVLQLPQEFEGEDGKSLLKSLGIEGEWEGIGHCAIGYPARELPAGAPRKPNRIIWA